MITHVKKINKFNPFVDESYITPTGTIHWIASGKVNTFHVKHIYDISFLCNRPLHINTG